MKNKIKLLFDYRKNTKEQYDDCAEIHVRDNKYMLITLQGCYLGASSLLNGIKELAMKNQVAVIRNLVFTE